METFLDVIIVLLIVLGIYFILQNPYSSSGQILKPAPKPQPIPEMSDLKDSEKTISTTSRSKIGGDGSSCGGGCGGGD